MSWGADDFIVFATESSKGLMRVPGVGGEPPKVLTSVGPDQDETEAGDLGCSGGQLMAPARTSA